MGLTTLEKTVLSFMRADRTLTTHDLQVICNVKSFRKMHQCILNIHKNHCLGKII